MSIETSQHGDVSLSEARRAVAQLTPRLTALLRSVPDPGAAAVGSWNVGEVAAHLAHVVGLDLHAAQGAGAEAALDKQEVAAPPVLSELRHMTAALLDRDPAREPARHATAIEEGIAALLDVCEEGDRTVPWLLGLTLSRTAVCSHQVYEMLVHGWDVARGAGVEWKIPADLACVAIEGFVVPAINGLGGGDPSDPPEATCEVRLRGGGRFVLALANGGITARPPRAGVDLHISADPAGMLLSISGRGGGRLARAVRGRFLAWGPRPRRGLTVFDAIKAP